MLFMIIKKILMKNVKRQRERERERESERVV